MYKRRIGVRNELLSLSTVSINTQRTRKKKKKNCFDRWFLFVLFSIFLLVRNTRH